MHKETAARVTKARRKQIEAHNRRTNIIQPNFEVGDFVLVRRAQDKGHKLNFRWLGPRRVVKVYSDLVYDVAKRNGGGIEHVHCARMLLYRPARENTQVSKELLDLAERSEAQLSWSTKSSPLARITMVSFFKYVGLGCRMKSTSRAYPSTRCMKICRTLSSRSSRIIRRISPLSTAPNRPFIFHHDRPSSFERSGAV